MDQSSPVHPVSELRGGTLSDERDTAGVVSGRFFSFLILDYYYYYHRELSWQKDCRCFPTLCSVFCRFQGSLLCLGLPRWGSPASGITWRRRRRRRRWSSPGLPWMASCPCGRPPAPPCPPAAAPPAPQRWRGGTPRKAAPARIAARCLSSSRRRSADNLSIKLSDCSSLSKL